MEIRKYCRGIKVCLEIITFAFILCLTGMRLDVKAADDSIKLQVNETYSVKELWGAGNVSKVLNFEIPSAGRIQFVFAECINPRYSLNYCDVAGIGVGHMNIRLDNKDEDSVSNLQAIQSGNYVASFSSAGSINEEATFTIKYETAGSYDGEVESNDSFDTANEIENNMIYLGDKSYGGDVDYYSFILKNPSKVEISVRSTEYRQPIKAELYEEDANQNVELVTSSNRYTNLFYPLRLPTGRYFLKIRPDQQYNICVKIVEESAEFYEQEKNNLSSQANKKDINKWYTGNIYEYDRQIYEEDKDWYQFNVPVKSYLATELKVPRQSEGRVGVTLYDMDKNQLVKIWNTENPYLKSDAVLAERGTYYICVTLVDDGGKYYNAWDYSICLNQREYIPIEKISLPTEKSMERGQSTVINAIITPTNASEQELLWSSSNNKVAEVDSQGRVTAKTAGSATITATAKIDGSKKATCRVRVYEKGKVPINSDNPVLSHKKASLTIGKALQLKLKGASGKIQWSSQSPSIAEVSATGKVRGKKVGKASVVASYKGKEYRCVLTILPTKQKITYAKSLKPGQVMLKWKRDKAAKGYQIQYSIDRKFKKNVKSVRVTNCKTYKKKITRMKQGKTYYFRIRSYGTSQGKKFYGTYSKSVKVKTRK